MGDTLANSRTSIISIGEIGKSILTVILFRVYSSHYDLCKIILVVAINACMHTYEVDPVFSGISCLPSPESGNIDLCIIGLLLF